MGPGRGLFAGFPGDTKQEGLGPSLVNSNSEYLRRSQKELSGMGVTPAHSPFPQPSASADDAGLPSLEEETGLTGLAVLSPIISTYA